jgi:hypothetical protein
LTNTKRAKLWFNEAVLLAMLSIAGYSALILLRYGVGYFALNKPLAPKKANQ